jgi:hypothetical protein
MTPREAHSRIAGIPIFPLLKLKEHIEGLINKVLDI